MKTIGLFPNASNKRFKQQLKITLQAKLQISHSEKTSFDHDSKNGIIALLNRKTGNG